MKRNMLHALIAVLLFLAPVGLAAYSWDGNSWADNTPYMSPITQTIKDNYRAIMATGQSNGRIEGRMGQIGDSITNSQAYFTGVMGGGTGTDETGHDYGPIMAWIGAPVSAADLPNGSNDLPASPNWNCWYRNPDNDGNGTVDTGVGAIDDWHKGSIWCNYSGWKISDAVSSGHPSAVISNMNMSWCLIMYGTNDVDTWNASSLDSDSQTWKTSYKNFVQGFIDGGVIPVLSTIPPEHAWAPNGGTGDERYKIANTRIKEICAEMDLAYVDFYTMIVTLQPGDTWDGAVYGGANCLIGDDGTHPTSVSGGFTQTALTTNGGYQARTKLTFDMAEKIKEIVFDNGPAETASLTITTSSPLPEASLGSAYSPVTLVAVNGTTPYTWTATGVPAGMTLTTAGVLQGTPTALGSFTIAVTVTDAGSNTANKNLTIDVTNNVTVTLSANADTYVDSGNPTTTYGTATLLTCVGGNGDTYTQITLFKFDLSGVPTGATIGSATLRVYCNNETATKGGICRVLGVTQDWTETGATFQSSGIADWPSTDVNNALDAASIATASMENQASVDGSGNSNPEYVAGPPPTGDDWEGNWVEFDVSTLVSDWVQGARSNYGLAVVTTGYLSNSTGTIIDPLYGYNAMNWQSKENTNVPELVVTYAGGTGPASGTLQFDQATYSVTEGAGATVTLSVQRTGGSTGAASVDWATADGTAIAGTDYTAASGTLSWADGNSDTKDIIINISNDSVLNPDRSFTVSLSNTSGAPLGTPNSATVTITDDDQPGTIQFSAATYSVAEDVTGGTLTLTLTRTGGTAGATQVQVAQTGGTATSGTDYTGLPATVTFADGSTADQTVTLTLVNDTDLEGSETADLTLSIVSGTATLGTQSTATVTITDDDLLPASSSKSSCSLSAERAMPVSGSVLVMACLVLVGIAVPTLMRKS